MNMMKVKKCDFCEHHAVIVDRILKDFANHRHYHINGEYHLGAAKTAYEFTNGANKVTIEFNWNLTRDNIYELIGKATKTVDEQIENKSKEKEAEVYIEYDTESVESLHPNLYGVSHRSGKYPWGMNVPEIEKVIFNEPATIVIWADGTKTIVKAQNGEPYDPEKGLTMAITKKALGNKGKYFDTIKKWTKEYKSKPKDVCDVTTAISMIFETRAEAESTLKQMKKLISLYGFATIADLYDLAGIPIRYREYEHNKLGWFNLDKATIETVGSRYTIRLPKHVPVEFETGEALE